jgi:hypothetical protein
MGNWCTGWINKSVDRRISDLVMNAATGGKWQQVLNARHDDGSSSIICTVKLGWRRATGTTFSSMSVALEWANFQVSDYRNDMDLDPTGTGTIPKWHAEWWFLRTFQCNGYGYLQSDLNTKRLGLWTLPHAAESCNGPQIHGTLRLVAEEMNCQC